MSRQQALDLECPQCGQAFDASLWLIVNVDSEPELKQALLDNTLNHATCPACGLSAPVTSPMVYHESERDMVVCLVPDSAGDEAERNDFAQQLVAALIVHLGSPAEIPEYLLRAALVSDMIELRDEVAGIGVQDAEPEFDLLPAFGALAGAQSQEDLLAVLRRHPVLLSNRTIDFIRSSADAAHGAGDESRRAYLATLAQFLADLRTRLPSKEGD